MSCSPSESIPVKKVIAQLCRPTSLTTICSDLWDVVTECLGTIVNVKNYIVYLFAVSIHAASS